jgi:hypothetical protein
MANNKTGLGYYNIDTDRYMDIKIKRLKKDFGCCGIAVYDYILCEIYRVKGCFITWDESTAFDVADYFGLKETLVSEIVNYCCVVGLFNKALLASGRILTSRSIQSRYIEICTRAKRKDFKIPEFCHIIPEQSGKLPEESPKTTEVRDEVKRSKVKGSKVKKEIELSGESSLSGDASPDPLDPLDPKVSFDPENPVSTPPGGEKEKDSAEKEKAAGNVSIDYEKFMNYFNEQTGGVFGKLTSMGDTRRKSLRARLVEHGKESFRDVIENAMESDFLRGQNRRGWTATFDWLIKPTNYEKVLSGNYKNNTFNHQNNAKQSKHHVPDLDYGQFKP